MEEQIVDGTMNGNDQGCLCPSTILIPSTRASHKSVERAVRGELLSITRAKKNRKWRKSEIWEKMGRGIRGQISPQELVPVEFLFSDLFCENVKAPVPFDSGGVAAYGAVAAPAARGGCHIGDSPAARGRRFGSSPRVVGNSQPRNG